MADTKSSFLTTSSKASADTAMQQKLAFNIGKYSATVVKGKQQFADLELARQRAKNIKHKAIANLDKHLVDFEATFTKRGGKVLWAETAEEALKEILTIMQRANAKTVVKAKSMVTEELHLNKFLEKNQITVFETDLGEYIQQMDGQPPFHIVTPAMHKSKEDVAKVFNEHHGTPIDSTPEQLTMKAREILREKYVTADVGISGANFIIADTGSICVTENEGNARLCFTFPKIHIVIAGIEKMLPSLKHLSLFWPLLATFGTGQQVTVYNSILSGPKQDAEADGPEEMYVILLDNGRSKVLAQTETREALYCIRCGACLNACPVYKNIGGHAYETTYSGPIGSVLTPWMKGMGEYNHLSNASSLCGNCTEVCPIRINLHNMLVYNRRDSVQGGHKNKTESFGWKIWKRTMLKRKRMNGFGAGTKNFGMNFLFGKSWGKDRELPKIAKQSFNQWWLEKEKK